MDSLNHQAVNNSSSPSPVSSHLLNPCNIQCRYCGALHWPEELALIDFKSKSYSFSMCCQKAEHKLVPGFVYQLSGKLLLLNTPAPPMVNYFHEMVSRVCPEVNKLEQGEEKVFTLGKVLVVTVMKPNPAAKEDLQLSRKQDLMILVNHSDWDPTVEFLNKF
ncbi:hypothetical protein PGTUg99_029858 [Puccinia graminis f. sp. tritici]|uniref:Uncharacterized protein n=1 Tax=Puccinia graminis f. sp. tritici TaxID=56615 RepID=A0A5B0RNZ9_PUCGR|nr:hypothetical protein PGTUg99_029858 [Puccinia graminis f. sp. tritici]